MNKSQSAASPRYALYARKRPGDHGKLVTIMLDPIAANRHADELCAVFGYASVDVKPYADADQIAETID